MRDVVWPRALEQIDRLERGPVEMTARDDDVALLEALTDAGFELTGEVAVETWMRPSTDRTCRRSRKGSRSSVAPRRRSGRTT